ncbi:MBL fold metallo-hydrolase [Brevibacillus centrosporus]|uniref:Glyoxylase, beta-lactamase superfamily II n=1 Tax=Brevibacillus centrosporus TaxID=54910 RepID=A0A1I3R3J2_9BACL|nr:MBL fold metallo-hydrolase [Brevibacillus centrosporus]MED4909024.1 MBL fold metallo-hydrolase [Brevibacillus centrosporus]SFJ40021.1 Glyoxylase, beta-lactamase superfamily II [Brevibacillus centrosporus]
MQVDILYEGFPGKSSRGFLGWSSCALIRPNHSKAILFDTAGFNERYSLLSRLDALQVANEQIGSVFISHFHFDHAVNYPLFENAQFYMHENEVEHIRMNGRTDLAVPVEMYQALAESGRLTLLTGSAGEVEGIHWRLTPGHTPGLCSLFFEYNHEKWVLASDAIKNRYELMTEKAAMTWDDGESTKSIQMIKEWADIVVTGHDGIIKIIREQTGTMVKALTNPTVEITLPTDASGKPDIRSLKL